MILKKYTTDSLENRLYNYISNIVLSYKKYYKEDKDNIYKLENINQNKKERFIKSSIINLMKNKRSININSEFLHVNSNYFDSIEYEEIVTTKSKYLAKQLLKKLPVDLNYYDNYGEFRLIKKFNVLVDDELLFFFHNKEEGLLEYVYIKNFHNRLNDLLEKVEI